MEQLVLNPSLMRFPPEPYQLEGATWLANHPRALLGDSPGAGKTKQVIDAAGTLFWLGEIDTVLVCCPAQVRPAWLDPDLGEIAKHAFVPSLVCELRGSRKILPRDLPQTLVWGITSYELARDRMFWRSLDVELRGRRLLVVMDESLGLADTQSLQHKAMWHLVRRHALYAWCLNGTPGNPLQVYGQLDILDPAIVGVKNRWHFLARYAIQMPVSEGSNVKKVVDWVNKDLLDRRVQGFVLRRTPPLSVARSTLPPLEVSLSTSIWKMYKDLRDQALASLDHDRQVASRNSMVKILRLCQITGGFIGGIEANPLAVVTPEPLEWLHNSKINAATTWLEDRLREEPTARPLVWARFTAELDRLVESFRGRGFRVWELRGGQAPAARRETLAALTPEAGGEGGVCVGQPQAGGLGLTLTRAHDALYYSSTFRWVDRDQTEGRTARKTQVADCRFWDLLACGPDGQRTIDHHVLRTVRKGGDIAAWTVSDWRQSLEEEG